MVNKNEYLQEYIKAFEKGLIKVIIGFPTAGKTKLVRELNDYIPVVDVDVIDKGLREVYAIPSYVGKAPDPSMDKTRDALNNVLEHTIRLALCTNVLVVTSLWSIIKNIVDIESLYDRVCSFIVADPYNICHRSLKRKDDPVITVEKATIWLRDITNAQLSKYGPLVWLKEKETIGDINPLKIVADYKNTKLKSEKGYLHIR